MPQLDATAEKLALESLAPNLERFEKLRELYPDAFVEGKLDPEKLRQILGEDVDLGPERYGLSWAGKSDALKAIQSLSTGTLRPSRQESVNFDATENMIIEGDTLEVLKLLQRSYYGRVKMIYIDPPYNTGGDFIYPDNYKEGLQEYLRFSRQISGEGVKLTTNPETSGRYHSRWLTMMYSRLFLSRNLLRDDGLIFVSIDDHEVHNLRLIMNEIFGEENFVVQFVWNTEGHTDNQFDVKVNHEYVLLYAKNWQKTSLGHVVDPNTRTESNLWKGFAENSITKNGRGNPPSEVLLPAGFPSVAEDFSLPASQLPDEFFKETANQGFISRQLTERYDVVYPIRRDAMIVQQGQLVEPCRVFSGWANLNKLREFIAAHCRPINDNGDELAFHLSERGVIYYRRNRAKARNILSVLRRMGTTERMRAELEEMGIVFQYPKPKELLTYLLQIASEMRD